MARPAVWLGAPDCDHAKAGRNALTASNTAASCSRCGTCPQRDSCASWTGAPAKTKTVTVARSNRSRPLRHSRGFIFSGHICGRALDSNN